ncbi:MAG: hypothetical protein UDD43_08615 [Agathobacter sp.]|nr:hypothetical protein [Agathobacter sp.]
MEKILKWVNEHKKISVLLIVIIVLLPIIIIHFLFKIKSGCYWIIAEWGAGDALGYFGDVLSFIGTIILGYVAICQTQKANNISEKLMEMELVKMKPCFDFINSQKLFISLIDDADKLKQIYKSEEAVFLDVLITTTPRTGMCTFVCSIVLDVFNSGHSDIRCVYAEIIDFYLFVGDKRNKEKRIAMITGGSDIKVGETKKLIIQIRREFVDEDDLKDTLYRDNIDNIMPHLEMRLHIVTIDGTDYYENVVLGTSWNCAMSSKINCIERELNVIDLEVFTES